MTTKTLKLRIKRKIENLPKEKLLVADDFISYLSEKDIENEATKELLMIPEFEQELNQAEESIKKGEGVNWRKVRRDV
jgi:hypothetical protein